MLLSGNNEQDSVQGRSPSYSSVLPLLGGRRPTSSFRSLASAFSLFPFPLPPPNDGRQLPTPTSSARIVKCINCNYVTNDLHVLMDHLDGHYPVKTFLCIYCYQSFPGQLELNHHLQMRECPFMGKVPTMP